MSVLEILIEILVTCYKLLNKIKDNHDGNL